MKKSMSIIWHNGGVFINNQGSVSFVIDRKHLTDEQILKIMNYVETAKELGIVSCEGRYDVYHLNDWGFRIEKGVFYGETFEGSNDIEEMLLAVIMCRVGVSKEEVAKVFGNLDRLEGVLIWSLERVL